MKMTYVILNDDSVIGKVYDHPILGRTICFEGSIKMDDTIQVWKMGNDGSHAKVTDKLGLEFFRGMIPL